LAWIRAWLAIISETTSPAPKRLARRRKGKSVTPDMGARITGLSSVIGPIRRVMAQVSFKAA
jgi:hypothetical protein